MRSCDLLRLSVLMHQWGQEENRKIAEEERTRKAEEERLLASAAPLVPWLEGVGIPAAAAGAIALGCAKVGVRSPVVLCAMPEDGLFATLSQLPPGPKQFAAAVIRAARHSASARQATRAPPGSTPGAEWLASAGLDGLTAAEVCTVLGRHQLRSLGLVVVQGQAELEPIAAEMPAPARHAFLSLVRDAREGQQFALGAPPRLVSERWTVSVRQFLESLMILDGVTIDEVVSACDRPDFQVGSLWSSMAWPVAHRA